MNAVDVQQAMLRQHTALESQNHKPRRGVYSLRYLMRSNGSISSRGLQSSSYLPVEYIVAGEQFEQLLEGSQVLNTYSNRSAAYHREWPIHHCSPVDLREVVAVELVP